MSEDQLDTPRPENKAFSNDKLFLGGLFAIALLFLYQQVFSLNWYLIFHFFDKGVISFFLKHLIPILTVVIVGLLFLNQLKNKPGPRMAKIFITWICSLFIFYILFRFGLRDLLIKLISREVLNTDYYNQKEPVFLTTYIEPLFYPITIATIIYLLLVASRIQPSKEI